MVHRAAVASMAWSGYSMLLLACGAAALDCHADFWPEMHASPRRLEALILANGALVKLCFDADADGAVHRRHARAFLKAAGLVDVTVAGGLEDVLQRNDAVEAIVEVLFAAKQRRRAPAAIRAGPLQRPATWDREAARRFDHKDRQERAPTKRLSRIRWSVCLGAACRSISRK